MIVETGTVVAIESDSLWVETIQKTACEACVAQKGCGTRVLSKLTGKTNRIRVLLDQAFRRCYRYRPGCGYCYSRRRHCQRFAAGLSVACDLCGLGAWLAGSGGDMVSILGALRFAGRWPDG